MYKVEKNIQFINRAIIYALIDDIRGKKSGVRITVPLKNTLFTAKNKLNELNRKHCLTHPETTTKVCADVQKKTLLQGSKLITYVMLSVETFGAPQSLSMSHNP